MTCQIYAIAVCCVLRVLCHLGLCTALPYRAFRLYLSSKVGKAAVLRATRRYATVALLQQATLNGSGKHQMPGGGAAVAASDPEAARQVQGEQPGHQQRLQDEGPQGQQQGLLREERRHEEQQMQEGGSVMEQGAAPGFGCYAVLPGLGSTSAAEAGAEGPCSRAGGDAGGHSVCAAAWGVGCPGAACGPEQNGAFEPCGAAAPQGATGLGTADAEPPEGAPGPAAAQQQRGPEADDLPGTPGATAAVGLGSTASPGLGQPAAAGSPSPADRHGVCATGTSPVYAPPLQDGSGGGRPPASGGSAVDAAPAPGAGADPCQDAGSPPTMSCPASPAGPPTTAAPAPAPQLAAHQALNAAVPEAVQDLDLGLMLRPDEEALIQDQIFSSTLITTPPAGSAGCRVLRMPLAAAPPGQGGTAGGHTGAVMLCAACTNGWQAGACVYLLA